jgi:hypothetical protein
MNYQTSSPERDRFRQIIVRIESLTAQGNKQVAALERTCVSGDGMNGSRPAWSARERFVHAIERPKTLGHPRTAINSPTISFSSNG